ncbi:hypothetical protein ACFO0N_18655 [Halobium salinum]|uniref:PH domain-containing protein n=1 Tax=Halobium salinum TaxID=1364940 RepID=A0ABD5PGW5_9EURY|nr:hypothetical protein [Halobium salinum]
MSSDAPFREVQQARRPRWLATVAGTTASLLLVAYEAESALFGAFVLLPGSGFFATLLYLRLTVEVRPEGLFVEYRPFHRGRLIPYARIESVEVREYRPATGFGRRGLQLGFDRPVYNVSGDDGVLLRYEGDDGTNREMVVGSNRASALAHEIRVARRSWRRARETDGEPDATRDPPLGRELFDPREHEPGRRTQSA